MSSHIQLFYSSIVELYGPLSRSTPVLGSEAALKSLILATNQGLYVQPLLYTPPLSSINGDLDALKVAYNHLQRQSNFPREDQLMIFDQPAVDGQTPELTHLNESMTSQGPLAFRRMDVNHVLRWLKMASSCLAHHTAQVRVYNLGIVTRVVMDDGVDVSAQLFESAHDVVATHTIWIHRQYSIDALGQHTEEWHAFDDGFYTAIPPPMESFIPTPQSETDTVDPQVFGTQGEASPGQSASQFVFVAPRATIFARTDTRSQRLAGIDHLLTLTDEQILTGDTNLIGEGGKNISGAAILRIAKNFSNTEIYEYINAILKREGKPMLRDPNVITRRITVALGSRAASEGRPKESLRHELNEARLFNGVQERMKQYVREKKAGLSPTIAAAEMIPGDR